MEERKYKLLSLNEILQMREPHRRGDNDNESQPDESSPSTKRLPWDMEKCYFKNMHIDCLRSHYESINLPQPRITFCGLDAKGWLEGVVPPACEGTPLGHLYTLLKTYRCVWHGLLEYINFQTAVGMFFLSGMRSMAECSLPERRSVFTPLVRMFRKMKLEPSQLERVARMIQKKRYCTLLALPCHGAHTGALYLPIGLIAHLQQKQEAGIVYVRAADKPQPPIHEMYIFPSCDFVNENLRVIAPNLLEHVVNQEHLLIVFIRARKVPPGTKLQIAKNPCEDK